MARVYSLDYLKLVLALCVVVAHSGLLQGLDNTPAFLIGNGLFRLIVPLFAMVSGWLFYSVSARGGEWRWLRRMALFYLAAMLIYIPFWFNPGAGLRGVAGVLVWGYFHLWFLVGLVFAGGLMIALRAAGMGWRPMTWLALVILMIVVVIEVAVITGAIDLKTHHYRNGLTMVFPFMVLGYAWAQSGRQPPRAEVLRWLMALALFLVLLEAWAVQYRYGVRVMVELPASTVLATPVIFLWVLGLRVRAPKWPLGFIAAAIYLLHVMAAMLVWWVIGGGALMAIAAGIILPAAVAMLVVRFSDKFRRIPAESKGYVARHS